MCQRSVERAIGKLVTDEGLRRRFAEGPRAVIAELVASGFELNPCEVRALAALDLRSLDLFSENIDPRLQKVGPQKGNE